MIRQSIEQSAAQSARQSRGQSGRQPLVVIGDALLDVDVDGVAGRLCPDAPVPVVQERAVRERPGGAGLAACLAARSDPGREVVLVTALGGDEVSTALRRLLEPYVTIVELPLDQPPPQKTRIRAAGHPLLRLDRGGGGTVGRSGGAAGGAADGGGDVPERGLADLLAAAGAVVVSDYGHGVAAHGRLRALLQNRAGRAPLVWDPHPRGPAPVPGALLATPSLTEASDFAGLGEGDSLRTAEDCGRYLTRTWRCASVAVTLGEQGALLSLGDGAPLFVPSPPAEDDARDACGAGDRFAVAVAQALADGALPSEAVLAAVEAAAEFVAAGGASTAYEHQDGPAAAEQAPRRATAVAREAGDAGGTADPVERTRAAGGTVVATGGCFDVLHAGHVATLRTARTLGDCLVVCLNSDASVRATKGPSRPLNSAADREAVLRSLACVDAVEVFDETTPETVLARLRPDVWVKGGDYGGRDLPESSLLAEWGGQTVVVPYVPGRSTTRIAGTSETAHEAGELSERSR